MTKAIITSVVAIAVLSASARAENVYVGWQSDDGGIIGVYDLGTGNPISPAVTFSPLSDKPQGLAVSPLDGNVYVAIDNSGPIQSYDPTTGNVVNSNFASLGNTVSGLCFDSAGNLYASTSYGSIAKITPDGTVNSNWGIPPFLADLIKDMTIRDNKLYGAMPESMGGTIAYDLSGSNEGIGEWFAYGDSSHGIAFGPDDTMYTTNSIFKGTRAWWSPDYQYMDSTSLGSFASGSGIEDIDYYDGYLYLKGNTTANGSGIYRYDLSAQSPEWELFISAPEGYTYYGGYLDITSAVPEPSVLSLLLVGLLGLLAYAWRKRK